MRTEVEHLLEAFQKSLEDSEFSSGEKQAIRQLLDEAGLTEEEKAYIRNRLFELARAYASESSQRNRSISALNWLDSAMKTLYKPMPELTQKAFFSPTDNCVEVINHNLRSARSTIRLCVFTITDDRISRQILRCHENGIACFILSDNEKAFDPGSDIKTLARAGIEVRIDNTSNHMHHKFAVIDEEIVLTGSYNWTRSAAHYNHENILVTNDATVVNRYMECFKNLWPEMAPFPLD